MSADNHKNIGESIPATKADIARVLDAVAASEARVLAAINARPASSTPKAAPSSGATLPNYGRRKNEPIAGAPVADLEYYAAGCRRTLDDPGKSKWHEKEKTLLAAIEAEIARQKGGAPAGDSPGFTDDDIPF